VLPISTGARSPFRSAITITGPPVSAAGDGGPEVVAGTISRSGATVFAVAPAIVVALDRVPIAMLEGMFVARTTATTAAQIQMNSFSPHQRVGCVRRNVLERASQDAGLSDGMPDGESVTLTPRPKTSPAGPVWSMVGLGVDGGIHPQMDSRSTRGCRSVSPCLLSR